MNSPEDKSSLDERIKQSSKFLTMSPPKIPVICLRSKNSKLAELKNNRYIFSYFFIKIQQILNRIAVPENYKVYQLMQNLRKSINLAKEEAIYLFINGECLVKPCKIVFL